VTALTFRRACVEDLGAVIDLLEDAKTWLGKQGSDQWQYATNVEALRGSIVAGECWLIVDETLGTVGTASLDENADPEFWVAEDQPSDALYVHRMIVRRSQAGRNLGGAILDWAADQAWHRGKRWLRLDAWRTNATLADYYRNQGFAWVRTVELPHRRSGILFQRPAAPVSDANRRD
jgi:GNAT superfamily N-acetyltransferase